MKLPGMPQSKVAVSAKAKREGWFFEEHTGLGGTRRMFELPARYRAITDMLKTSYEAPGRVVGTIGGGPGKADPDLLAVAVTALEEYAAECGEVIPPERKGAIIAVLYNYLVKGADNDEVRNMLRVMMH